MLRAKVIRKTFNILFKNYRPIDFGNLEEDKRNKVRLYLQELKNTSEIDEWSNALMELSRSLGDSKDSNAKFFSSQLRLVSLSSKALHDMICDEEDPSYFNKGLQEYLNELIDKLDKEAIMSDEHYQGDALRGFYLSSQLYYQLLKTPRKPLVASLPYKVIDEMKVVGKKAAKKPQIESFYDLFSKYVNRPIVDSPELTFTTNYLYRVFNEVMSSQDRFSKIDERNEFIKKFGGEMTEIGKAFEIDDIFTVYNSLLKIFNYTEN